MDFRQLRYFHAVARHRSITAASEALSVTQPAIGQQIRKLEDEMGLKLLSRHSRGMRLTPAGKILFSRAEEILAVIEKTERELCRYRDSNEGSVRIGVTPSLSRALVPALMEVAFDQHPGIKLLFSQGFPPDLARQWEQGELDFAFVQSEIDTEESESLPLYNEQLCLIGSPSLCTALPCPVPIEQVASLPIVLDARSIWLREQLERQFKALRIDWADLIQSSPIDTRREYLVQGRRFCVSPIAQFAQEIADGLAEARKIDHPAFNRTVFLAGPRVELLTQAEHAIRMLIIRLVDAEINSGKVAWSPPDWQLAETADN